MFPYLVLVGLAALAMGALNAHHRFFTAALGPAVLNVGDDRRGAGPRRPARPAHRRRSAIGVLVGGLGQLLVQLPELRRARRAAAALASSWRASRAARASRGGSGPPCSGWPRCRSWCSSTRCWPRCCPPAPISYLYYADRVMEFPLGVFGIALATASLPSMSAQAARRRARRAALARSSFALRLSAFVAVPADGGARAPGRAHRAACSSSAGEFARRRRRAHRRRPSPATRSGCPRFSATRIAAQTFYALGDTRTPVLVGFVSVAANVVLAPWS